MSLIERPLAGEYPSGYVLTPHDRLTDITNALSHSGHYADIETYIPLRRGAVCVGFYERSDPYFDLKSQTGRLYVAKTDDEFRLGITELKATDTGALLQSKAPVFNGYKPATSEQLYDGFETVVTSNGPRRLKGVLDGEPYDLPPEISLLNTDAFTQICINALEDAIKGYKPMRITDEF